jgi:hypothetical protein
MSAEFMADGPMVRPGQFHRLGVACHGRHTGKWLQTILGARPLNATVRPVSGPSPHEPGAAGVDQSGAESELLWLGNIPVALFTATDASGPLGRHLARHGPGLHSVAWTIEDLRSTEDLLRRRNVRITGTDAPGRHLLTHPADTSGLRIEWTDTCFEADPREGGLLPKIPTPLIDVRSVAWLTVAVRDAYRSAQVLTSLIETTVVPGNAAGCPAEEDTVDLAVGDVVIRLVSPRGWQSRYAAALAQHGERLHSICLAVDDLDETLEVLEREDLTVIARDERRAWTDPTATAGLTLEWTDRRGLRGPSRHG